MTEDEKVGWHYCLNEHEFMQTPRDSKEQESLACCSPWGHKELDMTERLNHNNNSLSMLQCRIFASKSTEAVSN